MANFKDLQFKKTQGSYSNRGTFYAIYPADEDGLRKVVVIEEPGYYSPKNAKYVSKIRYFDHDVTDEDIKQLSGESTLKKGVESATMNEEEFYKIAIPADFEAVREFKMKIVNNTVNLTDEEITNLILNNPKYNCVIKQENTKFPGIIYTMPKYEGKEIELSPEDKHHYYNSDINSKEYAEWFNNFHSGYYFSSSSSTATHSITMAMKHPDYEDGIIFYILKYKISIEKDIITHNVTCNYKIEHVPGVVSRAIKYVRKKEVESTAFEAFNINSRNISWSGNLQWVSENGNNWKSFFYDNLGYFEKSGFNALLKNNNSLSSHGGYYSNYGHIDSFIVIFTALLITYPVFELLIKMGYTKMFFDAYQNMKQKTNKAEIDAYIKTFEELVDNTATKGKMALRFPNYIGEYLKAKSAPIEEYFAWRDIYELENLSKDVFERIINSHQYAIFNFESDIRKLPNIVKYGYKVEKLINFTVKKFMENSGNDRHSYDMRSYLSTLGDYLHMCDMLDIKPELYPQDLKKDHDEVMVLFREKKDSINDARFSKIATQAKNYVVPSQSEIDDEKSKISKLWNEYTVIFPDSSKSLIEEGIQQHNCVGSYTRHVMDGYCIIFFIRKKDDPDKSFITAECTRNGLNQCMYQNNRRVTESEILNFANSICNKLLTGVRSGKIDALSNI